VEVNLGRQRRKVIPESLVPFGLFFSFLQPHLEHIACPMNGFPVLITYGGSRFHRLVADATGWGLGDKIQDFCHGVASEKNHRIAQETGAERGTAERCVKGLLIV
jgi:hypothetical protein